MAYTARLIWEGVLTELSKANSPSLLLHEFNYYFNKAINQYVNKLYNIYDVNQQTTDNLRVLKASAMLDVVPIYDPKLKSIQSYGTLNDVAKYKAGNANLFGATYEVILPDDYLHMLNCVCIYEMLKTHKCYNKGDYVPFAAKHLTADAWSIVMNDYYNRPLPERPYYYINNVNLKVDLPTNEFSEDKAGTTDQVWTGKEESNITSVAEYPITISLKDKDDTTLIEDVPGLRHANSSKVRCEIRYGSDNSVYRLDKVLIDYIKAPQTIRLTKEQVDLTEDKSLIMEFPDYVCQEIINELAVLVMQRDADPRWLSQMLVSTSIGQPAQQLAPQPQS